ncbi:MAG: glutamine-hydrolyzing carbamoyl-phosphate synthase small subunit [Pelagibacteraceae bacterium]
MKQINQNINSNKNLNKIDSTGILVLENGISFTGQGIGYEGNVTGEVCFNTSITGYQEIITDPSYSDQIINFTFPHIGNVGTNEEDNEASKAWVKGVILNTNITDASNYRSIKDLNKWLKENRIVGLIGLDTRMLTNYIRDKGAPKGTLSYDKSASHNINKLKLKSKNWRGLIGLDLASKVTCKKIYEWSAQKTWDKEKGYTKNTKSKYKIVAIDYGMKRNILRCFSDLGCKVIIVPAKTQINKILSLKPDGIFLSNGPGDPSATAIYAVPVIKKLINKKIPVFGICLGHQLLSLALGAKTSKMKLGHRGANHPVKYLKNNKVEITSQNHGFKVNQNSLPKNIKVTHISLFDKSIEGIELKNKPAFSVQYHPESSPGPQDSRYLFEKFIKHIKKNGKKKRS